MIRRTTVFLRPRKREETAIKKLVGEHKNWKDYRANQSSHACMFLYSCAVSKTRARSTKKPVTRELSDSDTTTMFQMRCNHVPYLTALMLRWPKATEPQKHAFGAVFRFALRRSSLSGLLSPKCLFVNGESVPLPGWKKNARYSHRREKKRLTTKGTSTHILSEMTAIMLYHEEMVSIDRMILLAKQNLEYLTIFQNFNVHVASFKRHCSLVQIRSATHAKTNYALIFSTDNWSRLRMIRNTIW